MDETANYNKKGGFSSFSSRPTTAAAANSARVKREEEEGMENLNDLSQWTILLGHDTIIPVKLNIIAHNL
jgi:hypothetical protein